MVFCGLYPIDGDEFPDLRDALEKLALNDARSLTSPRPRSRSASASACGFLGLLHMDIVRERLEREYNLELIATIPRSAS
jgi:GTP-binding protein LepA